jgi:ABC-2 type transport system permease protein
MRPDERGALQDLLRGAGRWNDTSRAAGSGAAGRGLTIPFDVKKEAMTSRRGVPYNGYAHSFAGMGVQFILFMAIEMGLGLLLQQREGLWRRLRAAPLSRGVLLGARSVSTALQSLFILFFMFLFARVVFGVRVDGSLAGFIGIAVAFSLMTASFGLLIAGLGRTPEGTRALSIVATLVLVMLGGAWVPTFVFPQWLQRLTVVVPTRWAVDGLDATTWRGLGFSSVAWPIVFLLGTAAICGSLAVARFRWDAD